MIILADKTNKAGVDLLLLSKEERELLPFIPLSELQHIDVRPYAWGLRIISVDFSGSISKVEKSFLQRNKAIYKF